MYRDPELSQGYEEREQRNFPITFAFHAEKLHQENTWRCTRRVARWMGEHGIRATFFVYPFRAQTARKDITDRVRTIAAMGHEIGQHTHFYAGTKIDGPEKINDLSDENIVHCLTRDFDTIKQMGFRPRAFTAGAWLINPTVCNTLVRLGFDYDCSAHFPKPKQSVQSANNYWLRSPRFHLSSQGRLLCLPTMCSLGEWFKWGRKMTTEGVYPYQLVYLHDYDLPLLRNRVMFPLFFSICSRENLQPLSTIAEQYRSRLQNESRPR
jgi:Polysaccharide deacetylase